MGIPPNPTLSVMHVHRYFTDERLVVAWCTLELNPVATCVSVNPSPMLIRIRTFQHQSAALHSPEREQKISQPPNIISVGAAYMCVLGQDDLAHKKMARSSYGVWILICMVSGFL